MRRQPQGPAHQADDVLNGIPIGPLYKILFNQLLWCIMIFISNNLVLIINILGLLFDFIGAVFVAYEVLIQFQGPRHGTGFGITGIVGGTVTLPAKETTEYRQWEISK